MRSLYLKLSIWSLLTMIACVVAFGFTLNTLSRSYTRGGGPFGGTLQWQADRAGTALASGGIEGLKRYATELDNNLRVPHALVNAEGMDLLSGANHSDWLAKATNNSFLPPPFPPGRFYVHRQSSDGKVHLLIEIDPPFKTSNSLPYFSAIFGAIALFSYALFRYLVSPVRQLSAALHRFGAGDLNARVAIVRRDELGDLARQFNEMAARIQTLLAAERRLLEDVSHELRSPLARLQFALEMVIDSSNRDVAVEKMRREIDRLSSLIGQLLDVTRAEGDPKSRVHAEVDLSALLQLTINDCQIEAQARQCEFNWNPQGPLLTAGDPELLRRAFENILRNAIRHSPNGSKIDVDLAKSTAEITFSVRDYGTGVPDEFLARIFEPLFRVDPSRSLSSGGMGLGLSIVDRAVRLHGGKVFAQNAAPGLRVFVNLPTRPLEDKAKPTP
jgi:signal transduction histidine kinase